MFFTRRQAPDTALSDRTRQHHAGRHSRRRGNKPPCQCIPGPGNAYAAKIYAQAVQHCLRTAHEYRRNKSKRGVCAVLLKYIQHQPVAAELDTRRTRTTGTIWGGMCRRAAGICSSSPRKSRNPDALRTPTDTRSPTRSAGYLPLSSCRPLPRL